MNENASSLIMPVAVKQALADLRKQLLAAGYSDFEAQGVTNGARESVEQRLLEEPSADPQELCRLIGEYADPDIGPGDTAVITKSQNRDWLALAGVPCATTLMLIAFFVNDEETGGALLLLGAAIAIAALVMGIITRRDSAGFAAAMLAGALFLFVLFALVV